ncbi:MAG: 2-phosphosulfolactate phosphatase [Dehalococcoidia bacterium]
MRLDVALVPALLTDLPGRVCIVVDVLRASSTVVTMLEREAEEVLLAPTIEAARRLHEELPSYLLCGEKGGLPPPGFDYGNSPSEFNALDLKGRRAILCTSNGTRAILAAADAPLVLVGCLLNASAVAAAAWREATARRLGITIVCAGEEGGKTFAEEDALGAGAILDAIVRPGRSGSTVLELTDETRAALEYYRTQQGREESVLRQTAHGRDLLALGLDHDLAFCARPNRFAAVPSLQRDAKERLVLRAYPSGSCG